MRGQAAPPGDPVPNFLGIDGHQELRSVTAHHRVTGLVGPPGGMKSEPRPGGDAQVITRDHAEHHGAGRQAGAINDHLLARSANRLVAVDIGTNLAAVIVSDTNSGGSGITNEADNSIQAVNPNTGDVRTLTSGKLAVPSGIKATTDSLLVADLFAFRNINPSSGQVREIKRMDNSDLEYPLSIGGVSAAPSFTMNRFDCVHSASSPL